MKHAINPRRVLRVPAAVHLAAKVQAATENKTLEQLASEVLQEALEQRRKRATDNTLRAAMAAPIPIQTRG